jgi:regulatory protein
MEARKKALKLLEFKDRSRKELLEKLRASGFSEEESEDAADYAASFGYVNDLRYAENYIRSRMEQKSSRTIRTELMQKGIEPDLIGQAYDEVSLDEAPDEQKIIRKLILKKYDAGEALTLKQYRNLCAGLARRGFSYDDIMHVLSSMEITRTE